MREENYSSKAEVAANQNVKERTYWLEKLSGEFARSSFPFDHQKKIDGIDGYNGALYRFNLSGQLYAKLMDLCKEADSLLHVILTAGLTLLLAKYTGHRDIVVGTPVYKQQTGSDFLNTVLALRNTLGDDITFKQLLKKVRTSLVEAMENQNYPVEILPRQLGMEASADGFPLFDTAVVLQGIQDKSYLRHIDVNITFCFSRSEEGGACEVDYNSRLFEAGTIARISGHFMHLLGEALDGMDTALSGISILSSHEKERILVDFNKTSCEYPRDKTIHRQFEEQVERTGDNIAVIGAMLDTGVRHLSFREVNRKAGRLAVVLKEKGVGPGVVVGLMVERSIEMMLGILAVLKAGGAYLPIAPGSPKGRVSYILKDSTAKLLLTRQSIGKGYDGPCELLELDDPALYRSEGGDVDDPASPGDLAYIIYTSGSTGTPKGVMVEHTALVNRLSWMQKQYPLDGRDVILHKTPFTFDVSVWEIFWWAVVGASVCLLEPGGEKDPGIITRTIRREQVTVAHFVPSMLNIFLDYVKEVDDSKALSGLKQVISSGEALTPAQVALFNRLLYKPNNTRLANLYGPTEATIDVSYFDCSSGRKLDKIPIGIPIDNIKLYIIAPGGAIQPVGIAGELCIAGTGLARGYLNRPDLTAEKFTSYPFSVNERMYKTGDLAKWLPDGNIEYIGRMDHQVKIRGFRIELGEIENRLLEHDKIKEAVVLVKENPNSGTGDKYLCAYTVSDEEIAPVDLQVYLAQTLPDYMVPTHFVEIEQIPLTPSGKLDRKVLPHPEMVTGSAYAAPRNELEEALVEIWTEVLGVSEEKIGITNLFFQSGGNSLNAVVMLSRVHKTFEVKIPLAELFKIQSIMSLARYIKEASPEAFSYIEAVEKRDYYPLSSAQKRLYILHQMAPGNIVYNMPETILLGDAPGIEKLQDTFKKLIKRHESLRTSFHMVGDEPVQRVHDEVEFNIGYYTPGSTNPWGRSRLRPFELSHAPLLRAEVAQTGDEHLLLVDMHHIITDGLSHQILVDDFTSLYEGRTLAPLPLQYKDFAQWQEHERDNERSKEQEKYWLQQFTGDIPILNLPTDYPRPAVQGFEGNNISFKLGAAGTRILTELLSAVNVTLFMFLVSVYNILLSKLSGREDIIIGIPIAGRRHADLEKIIGMFVNTLALRNYPTAGKSFKEFLHEVKGRCLEAFDNQEYPFEELVEKVDVLRDTGRNPLFDVMLSMQNFDSPGPRKTGDEADGTGEDNHGEEQTAPVAGPQPVDDAENRSQYISRTSKFDLTLTAAERGDDLFFSLMYSAKLFKPETIERFIAYFGRIISGIPKNGEILLAEIEVISQEEKQRLLYDFNDTGAEFPGEQTIHRLFEEQAGVSGDRIAVVAPAAGGIIHITYKEINQRAGSLARVLRAKGCGPGGIVALMAHPSIETIVGIMAVLKTGGCYLPIDPMFPPGRISYMLKDSEAKLLLSRSQPADENTFDVETLDIEVETLYARDNNRGLTETAAPAGETGPESPVYMIYTSGTTGNPKGVLLKHANLMNYTAWFSSTARLEAEDKSALLSSFAFDLGYTSVYPTLLKGGQLHLLTREVYMFPPDLLDYIRTHRISFLKMTPSLFSTIVADSDFSGETCRYLRLVLLGGEAINAADVETAYRLCQHIVIMNHYGPTEATIGCIARFIERSGLETFKGRPTIGKPISNTQVFILDRYLNLVPFGVSGEICIGGAALAKGYFKREQLTAEKFVDSTFGRFYRTGDLGRWLPDGNIEFLGRIDHQVKIRGYRVELAEIENRLLQHPDITEAAVLVGNDHPGDPYLCGYIAPAGSPSPGGETEIKGFLSETLPEYMVPAYLVTLEKLPLTPNGKLDRKALPLPDKSLSEAYIAPRDHIEEKLVETWSEVLNIGAGHTGGSPLSVTGNFFLLGGHSLKAVILLSKVHKEFNVKIPLAHLFNAPTIRGLANCIKEAARVEFAAIEPVEKKEYYPLSSAQKRLYILQQLELDSTAYNMPETIPLPAGPDIPKLEHTFLQLIDRHESLRTSFHMVENEPIQCVHPAVSFNIEYFDPAQLSHNLIRPFDLARAPLLRVGMAKLPGEEECVMLVDMHHIISDGVSHEILVNDFTSLHEGKAPAPLKIQYKDFAHWQNSEKEKESLKKQEIYWLKEFEGEIPLLDLSTDFARPAVRDFEGNSVTFFLEDTRALNELAGRQGATLYMVLLSLFNVFLAKLSGQEDIIIGSPTAGRRHADLEPVIGMFVNTLAMRNFPLGETRFIDFLNGVKERTLQAFENQDYQFEDLVEKVALSRDTGRNPLFDVLFVLQNVGSEPAPDDSPGLPDTPAEAGPPAMENRTSKFDLALRGAEIPGGMSFSLGYSTKLFKRETIERFLTYLRAILAAVLESPEVPLSDIEILSAQEKKQILVDFNDTRAQYPRDKSIQQCFAEQARRTPDHIAVTAQTPYKELTYRELNHRSLRLASFLRQKGVKPGRVAAIAVDRSVETIAAILAVLRAGCAYLPIDPSYPVKRIKFMLEDSGAALVAAGASPIEEYRDALEHIAPENILSLHDETLYAGGSNANANANADVGEDEYTADLPGSMEETNHSRDMGYIIYTSGTTGTPKGVVIEHRSVVNLATGLKKILFTQPPPINAALVSPYVFDASVKQIFTVLLSGNTLSIVPEEARLDGRLLLDFYKERNIRISDGTPAHVSILLNYKEQLNRDFPVEQFVIGGQELDITLCRQFFEAVGKEDFRIVNVYGPTECCDVSTFYTVSKENVYRLPRIPIGKPLGNVKTYIMGRLGEIRPTGVAGELYIGGHGLGRGYLNSPPLTAEKYVYHQFPTTTERLYRTGDLARRLPDGNIQYLGRADHQVKIRGYRIEPGEIENRLAEHPQIHETLVLPVEKEGDTQLCAYIVPLGGEEPGLPGEPELIDFLAEHMPPYMIPAYFMRIEKIPLTSSGKPDRGALPVPVITGGSHYTAPRDETEKTLVRLWSGLLAVEEENIGIDDGFFHLGGHSLKAVIMLAKVHKVFNARVPLSRVFNTPTIRGLAEYIKGSSKERFAAIKPAEKREYYPLASAQKRIFILQQMDPRSTVYNMPEIIPITGDTSISRLSAAFGKLIERHESLRTSFHMIQHQPAQIVHRYPDITFEIHRHDAGAGSAQEEPPPVPADIIEDFVRPFDLSIAPLLRANLVRIGKEQHVLLVDIHHIIFDGISRGLLIQDFTALVEGGDMPLLALQYKDFVQWQNSAGEKVRLRSQEEYWLQELKGELPVINLPTDYDRTPARSFDGASFEFEIEMSQSDALKELAREEGATLYMVLLAVYFIFLSKITQQEDIIVGTPVSGRGHADLERIIGMFVNTLALRNYPGGAKTFTAFLMELKENTLRAFENQEYQFDHLVEKLTPRRDGGRNPIFEVMFSFGSGDETPAEEQREKEIPAAGESLYRYEHVTAKFDLSLDVFAAGKLHFAFEYGAKLFERETVAEFAGYFKEIIGLVLKTKDIKLEDITLPHRLVRSKSRKPEIEFGF